VQVKVLEVYVTAVQAQKKYAQATEKVPRNTTARNASVRETGHTRCIT
jgi:hypothetical protein